jgi:hypothetical protein
MQPSKEIRFEVTEYETYSKRMLWGRGIILLLSVAFIIFMSIDNIPVYISITIAFPFLLITEIYGRLKNMYFITKIIINPSYTEVIYKYKNKEERILHGAFSDFDFKLKLTEWERYPEYYMVIRFQDKLVIRQFKVDNWNDGRIKQVVKDISLLKGIEFTDPALNSFGRKFIRLIFPKFNFD